MSPSKENQQPVVSVPVIIFGVIALGVLVYFLLQPSSSVSAPQLNVPNQSSPIVKPSNTPVSQADQTSQVIQPDQEIDNNLNQEKLPPVTTERDPFLASQLFRNTSKNASLPTPPPVTTPQPVIDIKPVTTEVASTTPSPEPSNEPKWNGLVTSKNDQVVLINYNHKSYPLHLGDKLPTTNYIVASINQDIVVLLSPKNKLELRMKKEAKK